MSDTLGNVERRIRDLIDDGAPSAYAVSQMRMWRVINAQIHQIGVLADMGQAWSTSVFTTVDGTSDYTLPTTTTAEYAAIVMLKDATHGTLIEKADTETIEALRQTGSTAVVKGFPVRFSLLEGATQVVTVRLYPVPNGAYAIDLLRSLLPVRLTSLSAVVPLARDLMMALELRCAARCARMMPEDERQKRMLTDGMIADFNADADLMLREGMRRIAQLKRMGQMERVSQ
jgi:hypothetical protein